MKAALKLIAYGVLAVVGLYLALLAAIYGGIFCGVLIAMAKGA